MSGDFGNGQSLPCCTTGPTNMVDFKKLPRLDLNPSSADRWTTCTASPKFIFDNWDKLPPRDDKYNTEGTTAHEVAAALLQNRKPREDDKYCCPVPVTPEMHRHAWDYMEYVEGLREPHSSLLVEQKLPLFYAEGRNAIIDAAVINVGHLHIIDFKYGQGVVVSPVKSLQATIYAKCVVDALKLGGTSDFSITVHIWQPRGRAAEDGASHIWETTWGEVKELSEQVQTKADLIKAHNMPINVIDDLEFKPSAKACQFCPAKGFCPERHKQLTDGIQTLQVIPDGPKHLPPVKAVSLAELAAIARHGPDIIKWIKDATAYAQQWASQGNKIPGMKLALTRGGNRHWSNPEAAAKLLLKDTILTEKEVYERSVITPAQAEKLVGKKKFGVALTNLITKNPGVPILVPEEDERPSCLMGNEDGFEPVAEE